MQATIEDHVKSVLKQEISRLTEGVVQPGDIADDLILFDLEDDGSENLGLDSLDALELAMTIEDEYDVDVPEDIDFKQLMTINDIVGYVLRVAQERDSLE